MTTALHVALRERLNVSDEAFAAQVGLVRMNVWKIRTGRTVPGADTALRILDALKALGVEMTLAELLSKPRRRRKAA